MLKVSSRVREWFRKIRTLIRSLFAAIVKVTITHTVNERPATQKEIERYERLQRKISDAFDEFEKENT